MNVHPSHALLAIVIVSCALFACSGPSAPPSAEATREAAVALPPEPAPPEAAISTAPETPEPAPAPTEPPTAAPTEAPTEAPTATPTPAPTPAPAPAPTASPKPPEAPASPATIEVAATKAGLKRVGASQCKMCHKTQHESWAASAHAALDPPLDCESCHGPGSEYKAMAVMKDKAKAIDAGLVLPEARFCTASCHESGWKDTMLAEAHAHKKG